jgi:pyruvate,water dikinase
VKIILDPLPEKPFDEGDILVTGMTRPDYIPYIKKSAGFITDAGGILSHAAITARELKKPCIIGTETGTKILKNGDMVEIDGEHGTVTVIT